MSNHKLWLARQSKWETASNKCRKLNWIIDMVDDFCFLSGKSNSKRKSSTRIFWKSQFPRQYPQWATMYLMCNTFFGSLGVAHWITRVPVMQKYFNYSLDPYIFDWDIPPVDAFGYDSDVGDIVMLKTI